MISMINLRKSPEWLERAADYFSAAWGIDRGVYHASMEDSIRTPKPVPRWYLMLRGKEIIGGFGLIQNDFMVREDLCPWLCALHVQPHVRGKGLGAELLSHARSEAGKLGFEKVYLNTDHIGYYEKYGWQYLGSFPHQSGEDARVYEADVPDEPEEMAAFFDARANIYDRHMLDNLGLDAFYATVSGCFDRPVEHLLDLGCGTGLECAGLFARFPDMRVTGIDLSEEMLRLFSEKYSDRNLRLICGSYFEEDFGGPFDCAISTYSLHHFSEERKLKLYRKIHAALKPDGLFVFGDYTVSAERQAELWAASEEKRRAQDISGDKLYHLDTPLTPDKEQRLMKMAGFAEVRVIRQWENASILLAKMRK